MKSVADFFKKIGGVQAKEFAKRDAVRVAIKEFIEIDISLGSVSFKSNTAFIKGIPHAARSNILLRKKEIVNKVNTLQNYLILTDIR